MLYSKYSYVNYFGIKKSCHFEQNGSFFNNEKLVNYVYSEGRGLHNSVPLDWDKMAGEGGEWTRDSGTSSPYDNGARSLTL